VVDVLLEDLWGGKEEGCFVALVSAEVISGKEALVQAVEVQIVVEERKVVVQGVLVDTVVV